MAEALLKKLGEDFTIACPAFPANGRSIYMGNLFVNGVPLAESSMRDHPLTPMRDSDLRGVLARQTRCDVGHVAYGDVEYVGGDKPTKEAFLHRVMYAKRAKCEAVVHLHSTHSVAVSCLHSIDEHNCLPLLTAYYVMRVGRLPLVPYHPPGDESLALAVEKLAADHHAVLLANHGPVVSGTSLSTALYPIEELEETAKLFLLLRDSETKPLTPVQVDELKKKFPN